jgi:hypothetical protein
MTNMHVHSFAHVFEIGETKDTGSVARYLGCHRAFGAISTSSEALSSAQQYVFKNYLRIPNTQRPTIVTIQ